MALYRYFPYWRHIRDDLRETLDSLAEDVLSYKAHPAQVSIGEILLELASAQTTFLSWIENPDAEATSYSLEDYSTSEAQRKILEQQWARLEEYGKQLSREDLTRQHVHPFEEAEFFSIYELLWELMRYEIHHMGKIELQLEAYRADFKSSDLPSFTTRRVTQRITMPRPEEEDANASDQEGEQEEIVVEEDLNTETSSENEENPIKEADTEKLPAPEAEEDQQEPSEELLGNEEVEELLSKEEKEEA